MENSRTYLLTGTAAYTEILVNGHPHGISSMIAAAREIISWYNQCKVRRISSGLMNVLSGPVMLDKIHINSGYILCVFPDFWQCSVPLKDLSKITAEPRFI
jgi:hypothetical protein